MKLCTCGHRVISHRYLLASGRNNGHCLASGCECEALEGPSDAQNGA